MSSGFVFFNFTSNIKLGNYFKNGTLKKSEIGLPIEK